jgi:hypothetical protein
MVNLPRVRGGEGQMHKLIGRLVATIGVDRTAADKAVGIILPFRREDGAQNNIAAHLDRRVSAATQTAQANPDSTDTATGIRMTAAGPRVREVPTVGRETFGYASHMAGENAVGDSVGAVPGRLV